MNFKNCYFEVRGFGGSFDSGWVVFESVEILFDTRIKGAMIGKLMYKQAF
jgi:hypothetical protein